MAKKHQAAAAPKKSAKKRESIEETLSRYEEPTYFKVKLLGDRYYEHYLHRAGATIVMLIDPALKPPRQLRILGEASPDEVGEDEEIEEEPVQQRGDSEEEKI